MKKPEWVSIQSSSSSGSSRSGSLLSRGQRQSVCSSVLFCGDMDEFEIEEEDCSDPAVDSVVWMERRVVEHSLDELGIHLDDKLPDTDREQLGLPESTKQSVKFEFGLGVA